MAIVTNIDGGSVMSSLAQGKFDIGENPYGCMTSIQNYTQSLFNAIDALQTNWASAVSDVGEYIDIFQMVAEPVIDPSLNSDPLGPETAASLKGVNTFLNVRSGAGTGNSAVGAIPTGAVFAVDTGDAKKDSDGTLWYHVRYKDANGKEVEGYASSKYISLDENSLNNNPSTTQPTPTLESNNASSASNVSNSSSTSSSGSTSSSSNVSSESQTANTNTSIDSAPIENNTNSDDMTNVGTVTLKNPNSHLNIRSTSDSSNNQNIVGQFSQGDKVNIIGEENGFYKIQSESGDIAYISKSYVEVPQSNNKIAPTVVDVPSRATVTLQHENSNLNFRSAPNRNTSNNIIGSISDKTEVEVLDRSGNWTKINYNGQEGWVYSKYLDK